MIGRDSREDMDSYGIWPWVVGVVLALVIFSLMFILASPIS